MNADSLLGAFIVGFLGGVVVTALLYIRLGRKGGPR